jgi:hypothetical protein
MDRKNIFGTLSFSPLEMLAMWLQLGACFEQFTMEW